MNEHILTWFQNIEDKDWHQTCCQSFQE